MMKWIFLLVVAFFVTMVFVDRIHTRYLTSLIDVEMVSMKDVSVKDASLETFAIVNDEAVERFAKRALSVMFNVRPAKFKEHVDAAHIKKLFISDKYHDAWKRQMSAWLSNEYGVNQISIKESAVVDSELMMSSELNGGKRLWRYSASLASIDRGLGSTELRQLRVQLNIVYLGPNAGMGIYSVAVW